MKNLTMKAWLAMPSAGFLACLSIAPLQAAPVRVTVSIENLAPVNSVSFAPLRFGFNNGTFDAFNEGSAAAAPIVSVAEGGSGSAWFPAFAAADPTAVLGSIMGALTPGQTRSSVSFDIDTAINQFFTFAAMVIPSNDLFIGNDDANEYRLFDAAGNLLLGSIEVSGGEIWNAGSEAADPLNAAFIVGGINANRTPENGVVGFSFSELSVFNGLTTAAGYTFSDAALARTTPIYRISFRSEAIPEPASFGMMSAALIGFAGWRRRKTAITS
jgi:hypothetical protein